MNRIIALTLLAAPTAQAHTLDSGSGVIAALVHELLGLHHLPLTLLVVLAGVALFRRWKKRTG